MINIIKGRDEHLGFSLITVHLCFIKELCEISLIIVGIGNVGIACWDYTCE